MPPKNRLRQNRILPKYWRLKKGTYYYRVPPHLRDKHDGKKEISLGQSLSDAYRRFSEMLEVNECITLMQELFDRYRLEVVPAHESKNTRDYKNTALDRLRAAMGDNLVTIITPQDIYKYRDHIGRTRSKKQANQDLETLSHVFTKSIEWGVIAEHPMTNKKVVKFPLPGRDRYVEDWELQEWAKVANKFLIAYVVLKGVTGLRQQDMLTIKKKDISDTELVSVNIKTGKKLRFPLYIEGAPTTVKLALDAVTAHYHEELVRKSKGNYLLPPVVSPWLFRTRKGDCYYDKDKNRSRGFASVWQRSMKKALEKTNLETSFTEHDLRAKVGSDVDSDIDAQKLLAHSDAATTRKHYRRKGSVVTPAGGFSLVKK
jgi:integrase